MPEQQSRRQFIKQSALSMAQAAAAGAIVWGTDLGAASPPAFGAGSLSARAVTTSADKHLADAGSIIWKSAAKETSGDTVVVDHSRKFQEILGFGAAFTDSACFTFNRLSEDERARLFTELFHPDRMGLSVCRTCIGSSDYAQVAYSFDDGEIDPQLKRFSIAHDKEYILPVLRQALKVNPDLFLFSSPWSPPGWMKANNSMLGGNMQRRYMSAYADYLLRFVKGYEAEGVPIRALTIQNEVDTDQDGRMPACLWPQEYEADFVRLFLGPRFQKEKLSTKIWIIDHNYNLWGRAISELETPLVKDFCQGVAWHGYMGSPELMTKVHDAHPDVDMFWTEGGSDYTDPTYATNYTSWAKTFTGIMRNWCRSITGWNLALDEVGRPNIGPFSCGGLVTIDSRSNAVSYSGQYYAFAHFSRFVKRGARRIESRLETADLYHVAFENPDGKKVVILTNTAGERTVKVQMAGKETELHLPKDSLTTLVVS